MASGNSLKRASKSRLILILGAGASKEFDLPLFNEIETTFRQKYKRHIKRLNTMSNELRKVGFSNDIENYISYARGQSAPTETVLSMNPFASYYVSRIMNPIVSLTFCRSRAENVGKDEYAKEFEEDIEDFIYDTYLIHDQEMQRKIISHYDAFFSHLKKKFFPNEELELDIFTTNYDDSIEFYSEERALSFFNGFKERADGLSNFEQAFYDVYNVRLYKLHGSVRIGIVQDNQNNTAYIDSKKRIGIGQTYKDNWKVSDRMMLLGHEKDLYKEPYFEMLRIMKEKLMTAEACIAIGYSFSNIPILNIFKDVLTHRDGNLTLTILNLAADKIVAERFPKYQRIVPIKGKFSDFNKI